MSYHSIDEIQKIMAKEVFSRTNDAKKASGRALGTFVEIITYYWLKANKLEKYLSIETSLPEYGNTNLTHNVEFTLHKILNKFENIPLDIYKNLSSKRIAKNNKLIINNMVNNNLINSKDIISIKNGCKLGFNDNSFFLAYANSNDCTYTIVELENTAHVMFECKRVGKEGDAKGPQTIEKAKQGAYVAMTVSSLQKIINKRGEEIGVYFDENNNLISDNYESIILKITNKKLNINNFILTVGIVSNHGNWFTEENKNKELEVLCNSYDWLLFLNDNGLCQFVRDVLEIDECKLAFRYSYDINENGRKNSNIFTKSIMSYGTYSVAPCFDFLGGMAQEKILFFATVGFETSRLCFWSVQF